jgi:hypothetical protein
MNRQVTGFIPGMENWYSTAVGSTDRLRWSPPKSRRKRELENLKTMKLVSKKKRLRSPKKDGKKRSKSTAINKCRKYLGKKIGINMAEYKRGRWVSPAQAIAVSYSETLKKFPRCKRYLKRKSKTPKRD